MNLESLRKPSAELAKGVGLVTVSYFRTGFIAAILGTLAVFLFRHATTPDEMAVFTLVPLVLYFAWARLLGALLSRLNLPKPAEPLQSRVRNFSVLFLIGFLAACVVVPSLFIYRALGVMWAVTLASRVLVMLLAVIATAALCVGMRLPSLYTVSIQSLGTLKKELDESKKNWYPDLHRTRNLLRVK